MEYSSNGKGNLGVTLGAIGTGLGLLGNGGIGNVFGRPIGPEFATKDELNYVQELAAKDSQIADLKAESISEQKMIEVYKAAHAEVASLRTDTMADIKELHAEINANRREQDAWNASQSVANAQMSAAIGINTNSIAALQNTLGNLTKVVVPNTSVCPGWGDVTITPKAG